MLVVSAAPVARASEWLVPPVDAPVSKAFEAPATRWASGHRGVDYAVAPGAQIRASGDGTVSWAGRVPEGIAVTIDHAEGLQTTYTLLAEAYVESGEVVAQGQWIGAASAAHPGYPDGLHFGVKLDGAYVDPAAYLGPTDVSNAIHLIPTSDEMSATADHPLLSRQIEGATVACTLEPDSQGDARAPNHNAVVVLGGINSEWDADSVPEPFSLPLKLGYSADKTYLFSYAGPRATSYDRSATYDDLRVAGARLDALMQRIGQAHPGTSVDILAHSQGGLVAREYLKGWAHAWDRPQVEHLVTFSTPHQGAPLAAEVDDLARGTITGAALMDLLTRFDHLDLGVAPVHLMPLAEAVETLENLVPDPYATSVAQMAPGSDYLARLASEDIAYGTRVLALQAPWDLMVPADHARYPGELNRVVGAALPQQHTAILDSPEALGLAHSFLRDSAEPCLMPDDEVGWAGGRFVSAAEAGLDHAYSAAETTVLAKALAPALVGVTPLRDGLAGAEGAYRAWRAGGAAGLRRWAQTRATNVALSGVGWYYDHTVQAIVGRAIRGTLRHLGGGT